MYLHVAQDLVRQHSFLDFNIVFSYSRRSSATATGESADPPQHPCYTHP